MKITGCLIKYDHPLKCCGRVRKIAKGAFAQDDGKRIPLLTREKSAGIYFTPDDVIGYGILHETNDGVFIEGYLNDSTAGKKAKETIDKEKDMFGVRANQLVFTEENIVSSGQIVSAGLCRLVGDDAAWIDTIEE